MITLKLFLIFVEKDYYYVFIWKAINFVLFHRILKFFFLPQQITKNGMLLWSSYSIFYHIC